MYDNPQLEVKDNVAPCAGTTNSICAAINVGSDPDTNGGTNGNGNGNGSTTNGNGNGNGSTKYGYGNGNGSTTNGNGNGGTTNGNGYEKATKAYVSLYYTSKELFDLHICLPS